MANKNNPFSVLYAIVEQVRTPSDPERFVIGYRTEESLREFLVESRIVASGYDSREEAARYCQAPALSMAA